MYYLPDPSTNRVPFFTCNIYHLAALTLINILFIVSAAVERDVNKIKFNMALVARRKQSQFFPDFSFKLSQKFCLLYNFVKLLMFRYLRGYY